jgi:hypothetical protein
MTNPSNLRRLFSARIKTLGLSAICASLLTHANAADLFEIRAQGTGPVISSSGSSILDLVDNLIKNQGEFSSLSGQTSFNAALDYAGADHAMFFYVNGNQATLQIPSTGFQRTFNGSSRADLQNQIEEFLKTDGIKEYSKFLEKMNEKSTVAVSDGNPNSSTALFATQTFMDYAFPQGETRAEKDEPEAASKERVGFGFMGDVGTFSSKGIKGTTYSLPLFAKFKLNNRMALGLNIPLNYTEIEGAKVFGGGINVALPSKIILRSEDNPWAWQLTPSAGLLTSISEDLLAGGMVSQFALSSMLSYDFDNFTLTMGNHFGWYEGVPVTIDDIEYDSHVSQQITKNGLKASIPFKDHWVFEIYGVHTAFLQAAAVDQYFTVGGELGWKPNPKKKRYWKLGIYSDIGDNYTSAHAQFGTAWKF